MTTSSDTTPLDIALLVGSLRKQSFSRKVALALQELAPPELALSLVEIGQLPLYTHDREVDPPPAEWAAFRARIAQARGVLFVTPEYNRSVPGALKNAIDVGSRPPGKSVWAKRPGAIVSVSPGSLAGFGANHHLRQSLAVLDVPTLAQPEAYIGGVDKLFDESGKLTAQPTRDLLSKLLVAYSDWVKRNSRG